jgi:hypothetical protein
MVWLNIALLLSFSLLLSAGILMRHRPHIHKRLMLLASISLIAPAMTRVMDWPLRGLGNNAYVPLLLGVTMLVIALGLHDLQSSGSVHRATIAGGTLIVASFAICTFVLPNTEVGRSLVYGLYEVMR